MRAEVTEAQNVDYLFTFSCPDRLGIMAKVTTLLYDQGAFVSNSHHYGDPESQMFFARLVLKSHWLKGSIEGLGKAIDTLAAELDMTVTLRPAAYRPKVMIAVSKYDHCLNMLLTKWRSSALNVDVVGVVSNHESCRGLVEWYGIPFHYCPVTQSTKQQQEAHILRLMNETAAELLVLARYMQILSDSMCAEVAGRAINIHHSFLPGFKGAKPYHQAHERGVKVIGATAHYVTSDLDEGPIIVQEVKAIDHSLTADDMVLVGHDSEAIALSTAVRLHCEGRVFMNGARTVVL